MYALEATTFPQQLFVYSDLTSSVNFGQVTEIQAVLPQHDFLSSDLTSSLIFGQVTDIHTYIHTYRIRRI